MCDAMASYLSMRCVPCTFQNGKVDRLEWIMYNADYDAETGSMKFATSVKEMWRALDKDGSHQVTVDEIRKAFVEEVATTSSTTSRHIASHHIPFHSIPLRYARPSLATPRPLSSAVQQHDNAARETSLRPPQP